MPRRTIADAAEELLAERCAATSEELGESIAAAGLTRATSPTLAVSPALQACHLGRDVDVVAVDPARIRQRLGL